MILNYIIIQILKIRPGPNFEECYLDTMGQSPLVEYYMYTQNARTVRNAQILVRHSHMLPKADYNHQNPTYDEIVQNSYKIIKKMEKELNEWVSVYD